MRGLKTQSGLSSIGWLVVIAVAGFFANFAFKTVPHYLDHRFVESSLTGLANSVEPLDEMSKGEIRGVLSKSFRVNNIRDVPASAISIDRDSDRVLVGIKYEVREPLFSNIEVLMSFHSMFDSSKPDQCCKPDPNFKAKSDQ